jgi:UDP-glucose 4-epimerase
MSNRPAILVADASAAREVLNFRPVHSDLATIIRTAWVWHQTAHPLKTDEPLVSPAA